MPQVIDQNTLLPLSEAVHLFPMIVSRSSLLRWAKEGIQDRQGNNVRLRIEYVGRRICTCKAWIDDFRAATQPHVQTPAELIAVDVDYRREKAKELLAALLG